MIEIDGSYGEGGGQVLRTSLALAAMTGQAVTFTRLRAGRRNPGLAPQHLAAVFAAARLCRAEVHGARQGATELVFRPRTRPAPGEYRFDVAEAAPSGSAGAASLVAQTVLLPLGLAGGASTVVARGGTHVPWSPPFDYLPGVYLPALARMGLAATARLDAWGFYPIGQGQITVHLEGARSLRPLTLTARGRLRRVTGLAVACNLPADIAQRLANRAQNVLRAAGLRAEITPRRERGPGPGAALILLADYEGAPAGFNAIGERGKPADQVADEACRALLAHHAADAPVDPHLADQLLLPLALAAGRSELRTSALTPHTLTNAHIIRQFVPAAITIEGEEGKPGTITVEGAPPVQETP